MLAFGLVIPVFGFLFETENALFSDVYNPQRLKFLYLLLMGSFSIGTLFGAPIVGALSDKFGRKKLLFFNYCSAIFCYCIFLAGIIWSNYGLMLFARVLGGLTGGSLLVVQSAIADVSTPEEKAKNFGLTGIAFGLGFIIGAGLGGILADPNWHPSFGYTMPFYACIGMYLINLVFLTVFFRETNQNLGLKKVSVFTGIQNFTKAFINPTFRYIFLVIFLITIAFNFLLQLYQFYARVEFNISKSGIGLLFVFVGLSIAIAQGVILPILSKKFSPSKLLIWILPIFALTYLLLLVPNQIAYFCAATFALLACQGVSFPTTLAIVSNKAADNIQGEVIGINQAVQSAAAACPIIIVATVQAFGNELEYSYPMYVGAAITFLGWIVFLIFCVKK